MNRRLIVGERIMYADGHAPVNCVFSTKLSGNFTTGQVTIALSKLQAKHPLLNVNIKGGENGVLSFVTNTAIPAIPVDILDRESDDHWKEVTVQQWEIPFDADNNPLLRLVWLKSENVSDFILVCSHCICDGTTFVTLMREFLQILDRPETSLLPYIAFNDILDLLPLEQTQNKGLKLKANFFSVIAKIAFFIMNRKEVHQNDNFYLLNWSLDKEIAAELLKKCKAEKTSMQAVLCAAFLSAFKVVLGQDARNKVISPVDIRRYIPGIKKDTMFAFAPIVELSLPKKSFGFWDDTRSIKNDLIEKIKNINMPEIIIMSEYFQGSAGQMIRHLRSTKGSHDVTLSNMGVLDIPEQYQSFSVGAIRSPAVGFPWKNANTLVVSTFLGKTDFSFSSYEGFLSQEKAVEIKEKVIEILMNEIGWEELVVKF